MNLGVLGSMVWDRIDHPGDRAVEGWGGISYSLAAGAAALPGGWRIRPVIKVGQDLADQAFSFLAGLPGLELPGGVTVTPHPNNRVHLRYRDHEHRHECLTGGVPGWEWQELEPHLHGLDALYINLISGFEITLDIARRIRAAFDGPIYADLHSLLLAVVDGGHRVPRVLDDRDEWLRAVDIAQVNEAEFRLVAGTDEPQEVAERAVAAGLTAFLITRAAAGATWIAARERPWPGIPGGVVTAAGDDVGGGATADPETIRTGRVPLERGAPRSGDPTGCGDVWGVTCFVALIRGATLEDAARRANRAAARNAAYHGTETLYQHLKEAE